MPDTSKLSKYLKPESVKDGDTITFLDAGVIIEKTFKRDGAEEKKNVLEITVKFKGENKTYSPNGTTVKLLSAAWGSDSDGWVNKTAVLFILPANNGKDMIVAKPKGESKGGKPAPAEGENEEAVEEVPF